MQKSLLGVAGLFLALVFNGVAYAEVNAAIPSTGGQYFERRVDSNLLAGNPVIVLFPLPHGGYHFVVIVGKEGWDYLIRDPAASPFRRAYPLRKLTDRIAGLCFFRTT